MQSMAKHILVVDDEERVLFVWREALRGLPDEYDVATAMTAAEARQMVQEMPFDLIITDIRLASESGVELTQMVRSLRADIPVVWMTAYGCYTVAEEVRRLAVFRCLDKPLEVSQIRQVVREALDRDAVGNHSPSCPDVPVKPQL